MGRSGTTWVSHWLAQNPEVATANETYFSLNVLTFLQTDQNPKGFVATAEARPFIQTVFARHAGGRRVFVEKSPARLVIEGVGAIEEMILAVLPEARILLFMRDGKDYVHSALNVPWKRKQPPVVSAVVQSWVTEMTYIAERRQRPETLVLRYEELITEPERMSREIANHIGISLHAPLRPWAEPINTVHREHDPERWRWLLADHRETLQKMNPLLERFGYAVVS
jgi:hypothetical protein